MEWGDCVIKGAATLDCIIPIFRNIVDWLLAFGATAAVIFVIFSGIRLITSGGDAKTVDEARKGIAFAVIGLILIFLSFLIINLVSTITGAKCIEKFGFTSCLQQTPRSSIDLSNPTCKGFCVNEDSCPSGSHEVFGATCSGSSQICCSK